MKFNQLRSAKKFEVTGEKLTLKAARLLLTVNEDIVAKLRFG